MARLGPCLVDADAALLTTRAILFTPQNGTGFMAKTQRVLQNAMSAAVLARYRGVG